MQLNIRHNTLYRYSKSVVYTIQQLRLTPTNGPAQRVIDWHIQTGGKADALIDTYGNVMHTMVLSEPHQEINIEVHGSVETCALNNGILPDASEHVPIMHYSCPTRLTEANAEIRELAGTAGNLAAPGDVLRLAELIVAQVRYKGGMTDVASTAVEALSLGAGVCQDHSHVMLACCRARGIPARYVSGYMSPGGSEEAASHAWVDVWLAGHGWVSVDVSHYCFASDIYCRVAVGRDYEAAAPIRGSRIGGGEEEMQVVVHIDESAVAPLNQTP